MSAGLGADELARSAGVTPERVAELTDLGLLEAAEGRYVAADVGRLNVVEALAGEGLPLEDLAQASRAGVVSLGWFEGVLPPAPALLDRTILQEAQSLGIPFELVARLFESWGVAVPAPGSHVRDDDARMLAHIASAYGALGRDDQRLIDAAKYFGDNIRRIAESQIAFFSREIIEPLVAEGRPIQDVIETINPLIVDVIRPAVRELLQWLHRRHVDALNMQMLVQTVETSLEKAGVELARTARPPTISFLDLSGFTRLTDSSGDDEAVVLATTLSDLVHRSASHHGGTVVKLLGDGVMFHFPDAAASVRCALDLVPEAARGDLPPARVGVHVGPVVFRDGDYFGRTVNVAARITDYARPREVLVSQAVVESVADASHVAFEPIGPVALKGVSEPVILHSARSTGAEA